MDLTPGAHPFCNVQGEVYEGWDARLARDLALKVIRDAFAPDSDRLAPFLSEAKLLASLNHPNLVAIYSFKQEAVVKSETGAAREANVWPCQRGRAERAGRRVSASRGG